MKRFGYVCLTWLAATSLSGCYFTSANPLPMKAEVDQTLLGCWHAAADPKKNSEDGYAVFAKDQEGWLQITLMEKYYENSETYRAFCSEIQGEKYLNAKKVSFAKGTQQPELEKEYSLIHYRIVDRQRLEMTLLNEKTFARAVKAGQLAGRLPGKGDDLRLTAATDQLAAFIMRQPRSELLGDPLLPMERTSRLPETKELQK